ncbi:MAG TPA: hypothetical protein VGB16_06410 [candidate division Zixibacteria bacterium]
MSEEHNSSQKRKPNLDILAEYEELLEDYNEILKISTKVLDEITKRFNEDTLMPLLEEKLKIADRISKASKQISQIELSGDSPVQVEIARQGKSIIAQIKNRAELLLKSENRIEEALRAKGLKIK